MNSPTGPLSPDCSRKGVCRGRARPPVEFGDVTAISRKTNGRRSAGPRNRFGLFEVGRKALPVQKSKIMNKIVDCYLQRAGVLPGAEHQQIGSKGGVCAKRDKERQNSKHGTKGHVLKKSHV
jgi:hypothetical protein